MPILTVGIVANPCRFLTNRSNSMKTSEQFALNEWLSYYPENMTYEEVIALMREPDNSWSADEISVWQVVEDFTLDQVADFIESTQSHFERVTA